MNDMALPPGYCEICKKSHKVWPFNITLARTQKAKGVLQARLGSILQCPPVLGILQQVTDAAHMEALLPLFARPCPMTPKHGYIDSRMVNTRAELEDLIKTVIDDDPQGEVLMMAKINAIGNAVLTPHLFLFGEGHDGATAGKNTLSVPICDPFIGYGSVYASSTYGIGPGEDPYMELVWDNQTNSWITQLRAGPKITSGGDFIPSARTVTKVLVADPALYQDREWERLIESAKDDPGVVVWNPTGGRTDHFSIHAFTHGIPILYGDKPEIGAVLEPKAESTTYDPALLLEGVRWAGDVELTPGNASYMCDFMLVLAHHATKLTGLYSFWYGVAVGLMLRFGTVAMIGEARHYRFRNSDTHKPDRSAAYRVAYKKSLYYHIGSLRALVNVFRYGQWPSSGFGGWKWAQCGAGLYDLANAVRNVAVNPSPVTAAATVRAMNVAINLAHNGGWWLGKFTQSNSFLHAAGNDLKFLIRSLGLGLMVMKRTPRARPAEVARFARFLQSTSRLNLSPPAVRSAKIIYTPVSHSLTLSLQVPALKRGSRIFLVTVPSISLHELWEKWTFLAGDDAGLKLIYAPPNENETVLWAENALTPNQNE